MKRKVGDIVKLHGSDVMKLNPQNEIMKFLNVEFEEGIECEIIGIDKRDEDDTQPYAVVAFDGTNPFGTEDAIFWCNDDEIMDVL